MSDYWVPSAISVHVTASDTPNLIVSASNQIEGLARIANIGAAADAFVDMVSASATAGENKRIPIPIGGVLFIAFGPRNQYVMAASNSVHAQAGYALK